MSVRRSGKPTLSDVAARAGVSTTTASYILNGRTAEMRISADTEERVRLGCHRAELPPQPQRPQPAHGVDLDDRPRSPTSSPAATSRATCSTEPTRPPASSTTSWSSARARACRDVEEQFIEDMLDRQVDGIIYATLAARAISAPLGTARPAGRAAQLHRPRSRPALGDARRRAGRPGRRRARCWPPAAPTASTSSARTPPTPSSPGPRVSRACTRRSGRRAVPLAGVVACEWAVTAAYDAVSAWLGTSPSPQGLICLNDRIAMGAYQALADRGLVIPDDLAVVSFDGSELAGWLRPKLSSVALPFEAMGRQAVRMLIDQSYLGPLEVRLPMVLEPGGSLPAPAQGRVDTRSSVTGVTSRRIVRHVPAGEGSNSTWQQ